MKIAAFTDLRMTASATPTGVSKHIAQMVRGLSEKPDVQLKVAATRDQFDAAGAIPAGNSLVGMQTTALPGSSNLMEALWTAFDAPRMDKHLGDVDWVYCPRNDIIAVGKPRWAVTFHGIHEFDPALGPPRDFRAALGATRWRLHARRLVRRADLLLTVSEFLKRQLMEFFDADPARIEVVGNGVEPFYFDAAGMPAGVAGQPNDRPIVLCVGGLNLLDGAQFLLPVAELLQKRDPAVRILVAGRDHEPEFLERAKALPNIELLGYVPAPNLAKLMRDAGVFLFLSRYETFGIAGAEAMAVGAPVIASNLTAVPDVIGDGGTIVDPTASADIVEQILTLLRTPSLRDEWCLKARAKASQYTWRACVDRLHAALTSR